MASQTILDLRWQKNGLFTTDEIYMRIQLTEMEIVHQLKVRRSSNKTIETKSNYSANSDKSSTSRNSTSSNESFKKPTNQQNANKWRHYRKTKLHDSRECNFLNNQNNNNNNSQSNYFLRKPQN